MTPQRSEPPQAVIFDVDGTLIDSNDLHAAAWAEAFRHFGCEIPFDEVRAQIGKGGDNLMPALLPPDLLERQDAIAAYRSDLFKREFLSRAEPFSGVRPLFERIAGAGQKIVLASSAKGEEVKAHLSLLGCADLVSATTSADDVEHTKPDPDVFRAALRKIAPLRPHEVLVIGDSPYDMMAAGKLGIPALAFRCGGFPDSELRDAGACALYEGPEDLWRRFEDSPLAASGKRSR